VIAFVSGLHGEMSSPEISAFDHARERSFRNVLKFKHAMPLHETFTAMFRMINSKALHSARGRVHTEVTARLHERDAVAIDGKALRDAFYSRFGSCRMRRPCDAHFPVGAVTGHDLTAEPIHNRRLSGHC